MKQILALGFLLTSLFTQAQTADEIVNKHIEALGGAEKMRKINSTVTEGTMNVMGNDLSLKITQVHNQGNRTDMSIAGMENYIIITPNGGYTYMPVQGMQKPEPMTADDLKEALDDLDIQSNLLDYKAKGHMVEYLGTEDLEGTECYKLKVVRKNSGEQTLLLDKSTYFILRTITKRKAMGQEMDMNVDFSDYRDVEGVKMPFSIGQGFGTMIVSSIKVNVPVSQDLFAAPK
jgi:hypothetical protein